MMSDRLLLRGEMGCTFQKRSALEMKIQSRTREKMLLPNRVNAVHLHILTSYNAPYPMVVQRKYVTPCLRELV